MVTSPPSSLPAVADAATRQIRGSTLLLCGRFVSLGLNLAVQVITVRYLAKTDYGALAFALAVASLGSSLAVFGLDKTIARFAAIYDQRGEHAKLLGAVLLVIAAVAGIGLALVVLAFAFQGILGRTVASSELSLTLTLVLIALAPVQALDAVFEQLFAAFSRARAIFFRKYLLGPGFKLLAVLVVLACHGNVFWLAVGHLIAGTAGLAICASLLGQVLMRRGLLTHLRHQRPQLPAGEIFRFGVPLFASDIAFLLRTTAVVLFLEFFHNSAAVADYRSVYPIAHLNNVVLQTFTFLFVPMLSRMLVDGSRHAIAEVHWKSMQWVTVVSFPLFLVTFVLAEPVTLLLFGPPYTSTGSVLAILSVGFYLEAACGLSIRTLRVFGKMRYILAIEMVATVLAVVLNLLLVPHYGALGGAVCVTATLAVHSLLNQLGLLWATGVSVFRWRYLHLYASVTLVSAVLWAVQHAWSPPLYVGLLLVAAGALLVLSIHRRGLPVEEAFPELLRLPLVRRLLGAAETSDRTKTSQRMVEEVL